MSKTFLIGCTHFGHKNIIRLANRPFVDLEEMERVMIERWNSVVGSDDTVFHLGDFSYKGRNPHHYRAKLNGQKIWIQGNHDGPRWGETRREINADGRLVVLDHYPLEEWNRWFRGSVHFHCHTHKPEFVSAERRGNVGVDAVNFTPIRLEEAIERVLA